MTNNTLKGLTEAEARARLRADGPNELPRQSSRSVFRIALQVSKEPMIQLLVAAGLIYLVLGDQGEALMLLAFVALSVSISVVQEKRTENVLEALRDLSSPRALVIRDGEQKRIAGRDVVKGDLLILAEGDRVPADARLISSTDLLIDESLLTGESMLVDKSASSSSGLASASASTSASPELSLSMMVYSGTLVAKGHGLAQVTAIGLLSEIGKIGRLLGELKDQPTQLHRETRRFVKIFGVIGITLSLTVTLVFGLMREAWLEGVLAGITLAMSMLPEEFVLVLSVFMAMGAWRISKQRVLTRKSSTIEALGSATVLCTDKTGTLTLNRMAVAAIEAPDDRWSSRQADFPEAVHTTLEYAILASDATPSDPMDLAFHELGSRVLADSEHLHGEWMLAYEYGLSADLLAVSHVWKDQSQTGFVIASKGSPEAVMDLCHLRADDVEKWRRATNRMAEQGLRVLGVARSSFHGDTWPGNQHAFDFEFLGLVGLADPLRPSVPQAVRECQAAGIRVVMITGDYPVTALSIAREAGIVSAQDDHRVVMTGEQLATLSPAALAEQVRVMKVYARIRPEQKLMIVNALKADGEIVAMTGDGVNDAPALRAADIGIAMGKRGTDVAREASSMVLLQDDFGSIVTTIAQGRRIYANLRKALAYVIAVHVPIAGLTMLPLLFGMPLLFFPAHIAFLEMIIDPTSCFVFEGEPADPALMQQPPRPTNAPLFSAELLVWSLLQGGIVFGSIAGLYGWMLLQGFAEGELRAASFTALVISGSLLVLSNLSGQSRPGRQSRPGSLDDLGWGRSKRRTVAQVVGGHNRSLYWILSVTSLVLLAVLTFAPLRDLFRFAPVEGLPFLAIAVTCAVSVVLLWLLRRFAFARLGIS
jgi:Ca2+-transporting ATPase